MATRRERVVLELEDRFTAPTARAAAAATLLKNALDGVDGSATRSGKSLDEPAKGATKIGDSSNRAGPQIDKLSGRLRILTDAAVTLGPALVPLGAASIPVLTASLAGLGAAAGGIGATVLAFKGLGDGLKALQDYQLEPTAENLQKLRVEMEKLGPSGAHFVRFLDDLEPTLRDLQDTARDGIFPGVEDGITSMLDRLPQVKRIVANLADEMGNLARDAGSALSSDEWTPFFDYVESEAAPTLDDFARSAGNVALGVANLLVAFAPLSSDFTGGLEEATQAFADWSANLDSNEGFQSFLDYIRQSGPAAIEFLGALAQAVGALLEAAAPLGQLVLPALTSVLKVFAAIGQSDAGPALYAAAAGLLAFNRAAALSSTYGPKLSKTFGSLSKANLAQSAAGVGLLALSMSDLDDQAGMTNTSMGAFAGLVVGGPWGLAIGAAVGQVLDFKNAFDDANQSIADADDALRNNDANEMLKARADLMAQLAKEHPDEGTLGNYFDAVKGSFHDFSGQTEDFKDRIEDINRSLASGGDVADLFGETIGQTADQLRTAAGGAQEFSDALAGLNGWFDKREAVRNYKDSIDDLKKSIKDGFTREDASNIDSVGRSILQVAQGMGSEKKRADFLAGARQSLLDLGKAGPKTKAAVQEVIDKMDQLGLTHPKPKIDVDDTQAQAKVKKTKKSFDIMDALAAKPKVEIDDTKTQLVIRRTNLSLSRINAIRANPVVNVQAGDSLSLIDRVRNALASLHNRTLTVTVNQRGGVTSSAGGHSADGSADGGTVPRSGLPYADRWSYMLADGEEVISNRHGQADRHRSLLKAINAGRLANGGTAGNPYHVAGGGAYHVEGSGGLYHVEDAANGAANGLKGLKKQLEAQQKAYDAAKSARDEAISRRDSISSSIQQGLAGDDIWSASTGSAWAAGAHSANSPAGALAALQERKARAQRLVAAINTLKQKGVSGPALLEIIGSGDVERAEAMAALDVGSLGEFSTAVNDSNSALAAAGLAGGNAIEGDNIREWRRAAADELKELKEIKQALKDADKNNQQGHKDNGVYVGEVVNGAAHHGHRRGR